MLSREEQPMGEGKFLTPEEKATDRAVRHNDQYAKQLARQQKELPCHFCNSLWGHYGHCALLNGGPEGYTEEQRATLKSMGLSEDDGWQFEEKNQGLPSRHATWTEHCIYIHQKENAQS
jgi:hypothetical protein